MKTQISNLLSGAKHQILNPNIDYSKFPKSTTHNGHAGSNSQACSEMFQKVIAENPEVLNIKIGDFTFELKANWSKSRKSVNYFTYVDRDLFKEMFGVDYGSHKFSPFINIANANYIEIHNGKNYRAVICPSLVEIFKGFFLKPPPRTEINAGLWRHKPLNNYNNDKSISPHHRVNQK